jgi:hypothetical protein
VLDELNAIELDISCIAISRANVADAICNELEELVSEIVDEAHARESASGSEQPALEPRAPSPPAPPPALAVDPASLPHADTDARELQKAAWPVAGVDRFDRAFHALTQCSACSTRKAFARLHRFAICSWRAARSRRDLAARACAAHSAGVGTA